MMAKHRFRFIGRRLKDDSWALSHDDALHCLKVLRLKTGDQIEITDGQGLWTEAEIFSLSSQQVICTSRIDHHEHAKKATLNLVLGALKPASFDDILPGLVELGVDSIHLFLSGQSEKKRLSEKLLERWQRIITGAVKQSKRAWIPDLTCHKDINECMKSLKPQGNRYILTPSTHMHMLEAPFTKEQPTYLFVGNEHGMTEKELQLLRSEGCIDTHIGGHILRASTACLAASSIASSMSFMHQK